MRDASNLVDVRRGIASGLVFFAFGLLLLSPVHTREQRLGRKLQQNAVEESQDTVKVVSENVTRPFFKLKDPAQADSRAAQRIYEQGASVSSIAYLLFAAAEPLSRAEGSSNVLLPFLNPTVMRLYVSGPQRCNSSLAEQLYDLSQAMYGTGALKACHFSLYQALRSTFSWVRDNIPLRTQALPGQPDALAAWPDLDLTSDLELLVAVASALADGDDVGDAASLLEDSCGLSIEGFAGLVPQISGVLADLHADLPLLQQIALTLHESHWTPDSSGEADRRRRRVALDNGGFVEVADDAEELLDDEAGAVEGAGEFDNVIRQRAKRRATQRRRQLLQTGSTSFAMPPSTFTVVAPGTLPKLSIPLVFHVMTYSEANGTTGPAKYDQALAFVNRMVKVTNTMSKPTNIQFFVKEVRNNPTTYSYLNIADRTTWLNTPVCASTVAVCFANKNYVSPLLVDWPRSINVFVSSDSLALTTVPLGYAYVPGSDINPINGHIFITWDSLSVDGSNQLSAYNDGANTLLHELFHHLGLQHPFGPTNDAANSCSDDDYVADTPTTLGSSSSSSYISTAQSYCMELFWGVHGGDWDATYARWGSTLGVPEEDMNSWADSCPTRAGYDEMGNYMTYNTPVCFAALGHLTLGQAQMAHFVTAEMNPVMYAWGQYYAANAAPPPPMASPPPEVYTNICKATRNNCACKASWTLNTVSYAYCDRTGSNNALTCEVADPAGCADCASFTTSACIIACTGTARQCRKSLANSSLVPPPPPPRPPSPPPMPPPPPPRTIPDSCKRAANGCACRSTWQYNGKYWNYCANPDNDPRGLWCQVDSSCATFNYTSPYQFCAISLTVTGCNVQQAYFSQNRNPPWPPAPPLPPAPPPDLRPRPPPSLALPPGTGTGGSTTATSSPPPPPASSPPPPPVVVASIAASVTINANCSLLGANEAVLRVDLLAELSRVLNVPSSYITINSFSCGSIIANYTVQFPAGATAAQVTIAKSATGSLSTAASSTFTSKWGAITTSSSGNVEVLQPSTLCPAGTPISALCPASPPPPPVVAATPSPSGDGDDGIPLAIIIGCAAGGGALLLIVVIIIIVCVTRNNKPQPAHFKQGKVAPHPQVAAQHQQHQQAAPAGMPAANFRPEGGYDATGSNLPYYRQPQYQQQPGQHYQQQPGAYQQAAVYPQYQ